MFKNINKNYLEVCIQKIKVRIEVNNKTLKYTLKLVISNILSSNVETKEFIFNIIF